MKLPFDCLARPMVCGFACLAPFLTLLLWSWNLWAALMVLFVSHLALLYPTLTPTSQWWGSVVTCFSTNDKEIWLTIDDGPDANDTPRLLDVLDRHYAKATFFVKGERVASQPELTREILKRGHSVGNHTYTHPSSSFWCLAPARVSEEIERCSNEIVRATGLAPAYFRAPAGMKNPFVHPQLRKQHLRLIAWSARGYDAVLRDVNKIVGRVMDSVRPGAIILLHEGSGRAEFHPACVARVLEELTRAGYRCVLPAPERLR